jgi:hypothetical protein
VQRLRRQERSGPRDGRGQGRARGLFGGGPARLKSGERRVPGEPHQLEQPPAPLLDGRQLAGGPHVERGVFGHGGSEFGMRGVFGR